MRWPFMMVAGFVLPAHAADIETFQFSGSAADQGGTLQVHSAQIGRANSGYAALGLVYARNPLELEVEGEAQPWVTNVFSAAALGGYNVFGRFRLDLAVPFYPVVGTGDLATELGGASMGDMKLGANVHIWGLESHAFHLAVVPSLTLPTGAASDFYGAGWGGDVSLAASGKAGKFAWAANLGSHLAAASSLPIEGLTTVDPREISVGSAFLVGTGASYAVAEAFRLGAELDGRFTFGADDWTGNNLELHAYGTYGEEAGLQATLAAGTGLYAGIGAPQLRVAMLGGWRFPGGPPDRDKDGITDDVDLCRDVPEDVDQFEDADGCPDPDNDQDGVLDNVDGCPIEAEDHDKFADDDGCPDPDNDNDTVLDVDDACPNHAGPVRTRGCPDSDNDGLGDTEDECPNEAGPAETKGCPDRDGDRVPDNRDKCPDKPVDRRADPTRTDGCPATVVVGKDAIVILDRIYFEFNKAKIKPVSYRLLDEIAAVLKNNPDLELIEVGGHTDSVGNDAYNLKLSNDRATEVKKYLTTRGGVDNSRLNAVGFGETKPLASNDSEEGRATNRRVEFVIVKRKNP